MKRNNSVCFPLDSLSGRSSFASICLPQRRLICFIYNRLDQTESCPTSMPAALGCLQQQTRAKPTVSIEFCHRHRSVINDQTQKMLSMELIHSDNLNIQSNLSPSEHIYEFIDGKKNPHFKQSFKH